MNFREGKFQKASELYSKAIKESKSAILYCNNATALFELKMYKKAIAQALKAIDCDKTYFKAFWRIAESYKALNNKNQALKFYKKALELKNNSKEVVENIIALTQPDKANKRLKIGYFAIVGIVVVGVLYAMVNKLKTEK